MSETTSDHEKIIKWVEDRGGKPAKVKGTGTMLRFLFSDNPALEEIGWDDFFKEFDSKNLALLYQETTKDGKPSRFFKFVSRV
ncbi:hypothetical protein HY310_00415 [Candidatus Microgenomates bacterium]|nr:hypothetical protein [Candidatus Microgenomates bacterium]